MHQYAPGDDTLNTSRSSGATAGSWVGPMIVGAVIFATGCGSGVLVGWFGAMANGVGSALGSAITAAMGPVDATLAVQSPDTVTLGEPFDVIVTITDTRQAPRIIETLDFNGYLAQAASFEAIAPKEDSQYNDGYWQEYTLSDPLAASASATYTVTLTIDTAGTYNGTIDVYMDQFATVSQPITITAE